MSLAHKGKSAGMNGKKHTEGTKKRMSLAKTGIKHSEETKRKMSEAHKGVKKKPFTNEHKKNLSNARKKSISEGRSIIPKGEEHHLWKGGEIMNNGYVYVTTDVKGIAEYKGYVKRANLVWYENTGEKINPPYCIHHKDGDRTNDAFENLQKVTKPEHSKIHKDKIKFKELKCKRLKKQN